MRLEPSEITEIKQAINQFITDNYYKLYLFGSRIDPSKKGGDIDLLLAVKNDAPVRKAMILPIKHQILAEIKHSIGDQKIDLVIAEERELATDPFLREIIKTAVRL